jgi:3'(2'), 5'-bisphosphate nucleotidase
MGVFARELEVAVQLAREAGQLVLEVYGGAFEVYLKANDQAPVTEADRHANTLLVDGLRRAFSTDDIVAEESPDRNQQHRDERCWFVDPLDGTREFVDRTGMFAIQIGLAIQGIPRLGVVYSPVDDRMFVGVPGHFAYVEQRGERRPLALVPGPSHTDELRLLVSRSHPSPVTERFRQELGIHHVQSMGSVGWGSSVARSPRAAETSTCTRVPRLASGTPARRRRCFAPAAACLPISRARVIPMTGARSRTAVG